MGNTGKIKNQIYLFTMKVLSAFALIAAQVWALFDGDNIEILTSDNWDEKVINDEENAWVVTYYADWCPYCKSFSDEYDLAASDPTLADKKIKFGSVDVMANRDLTKKYEIKRSPTVKVFGKDKTAPEDYVGQRKSADIITYCDGYCTDHGYVILPPEPKFDYNVDAVVGTISAAHKKRVLDAQAAHTTNIYTIESSLPASLESVKSDFATKLEQLSAERYTAMQTAYDEVQK